MRLLDLFCGAGGAAEGYHRAGFEVIGVDIEPQPHYPFEFIQADATAFPFDGFDFIHASPPCHDHSSLRHITGKDHGTGWMLQHTLDRLQDFNGPWVCENVEGADLPGSFILCGSQFGLSTVSDEKGEVWLKRHRKFVANFSVEDPGTHTCRTKGRKTIGVYGHGDGGGRGWKGSFQDRKNVMQIQWMNRDELAQAIPPAYTEYIGRQFLNSL